MAPLFQISPPKSCMHLSCPYTCYIRRPSPPPLLYHTNNTRRLVQITKIFITQFSPAFCYFLALRPPVSSWANYSLQPSADVPPLMWYQALNVVKQAIKYSESLVVHARRNMFPETRITGVGISVSLHLALHSAACSGELRMAKLCTHTWRAYSFHPLSMQ